MLLEACADKDAPQAEKDFSFWTLYLEGQGDLVSGLMIPISPIMTLVILIIDLLTKSL